MLYPNFAWEAKFENTLITKTNLSPFYRVDQLRGDGMTVQVNTYTPSGSIEGVNNREGNSESFTNNIETKDYTVNCYQGGFSISDNEAQDTNTAVALMGGVAEAFVNEFNEQAIEAMLTTEQTVDIDFTSEEEYYLYDKLCDMLEYLGEDAEHAYILVSYDNLAWVKKQLHGDMLGYNAKWARSGYVGSMAGVPLFVSKAMPVDNLAVGCAEGITVFLKGDIETEKDYDPDARITYARYRKYGIVALTDGSKVVKGSKYEPYIDFDDPYLWYDIATNRQRIKNGSITLENRDYFLHSFYRKDLHTVAGYPLLPQNITGTATSVPAIVFDSPYEYDAVVNSITSDWLYPKYPISKDMSCVHLEKVEDGKWIVSKEDQLGNTLYLSADTLGDNIWIKDISYIDISLGISNLDHTQWIKEISDGGIVKYTCGNSGDHANLRFNDITGNVAGYFDAHTQYGDVPFKYATEFYITVNGGEPIYAIDKGYGNYKFDYTPQVGDVIQPYLKFDGFKLTPAPEIVYQKPEMEDGLYSFDYDVFGADVPTVVYHVKDKAGGELWDVTPVGKLRVTHDGVTTTYTGTTNPTTNTITFTDCEIAGDDEVWFVFNHPYFAEYEEEVEVVWEGLKLTANSASTIQLQSDGTITDAYEFSVNNGKTWSDLMLNDTTIMLATGDSACIRAKTSIEHSASNYIRFTMNGSVSASGNANSMLTPSFEGLTDISAYPYAFKLLFENCNALTTAPSLPATVLSDRCYDRMFMGCKNLTTAPSLPATATTTQCYNYMFQGCTSLVELPQLPAQALVANCYTFMFQDCTKIKISTTQTGEYTSQYRIPTIGTGTSTSTSNTRNMFTNTGGTFKGAPVINTIYYTSNTIV